MTPADVVNAARTTLRGPLAISSYSNTNDLPEAEQLQEAIGVFMQRVKAES